MRWLGRPALADKTHVDIKGYWVGRAEGEYKGSRVAISEPNMKMKPHVPSHMRRKTMGRATATAERNQETDECKDEKGCFK